MSDNEWINEELQSVQMPEGLAARLKEIGTFSDADLDGALCDIHPSIRLRDQLLSIGTLDDTDLDQELCAVPVSATFVRDCQRAIHNDVLVVRKKRSYALQYASVAAILLVVITGLSLHYWNSPAGPTTARPNSVATTISKQHTNVGLPNARDQHIASKVTSEKPLSNNFAQGTPSVDPLDELDQNPIPNVDNSFDPKNSIGEKESIANQNLLAHNPNNAFGGAPTSDPSLRFKSVSETHEHGMTPPRAREYDLLFQLRHGVHPYVSPSSNRALATLQIPLSTRTTSFDQSMAQLERHVLPAAHKIRVEEFLAAMNFEFADAGAESVGIRTAAGRSPWNEHGFGLLQIGLQAGKVARGSDTAAHVIFAIDGSVNQLTDQRWNKTIDGLDMLASDLLPNDRVTVVILNQQTSELLRYIPANKFRASLADLRKYQPNGSTDYQTGLSDLARIVREINDQQRSVTNDDPKAGERVLNSRIMLLTSGFVHLDQEKSQQLETEFKSLFKSGASLDVLDVREEEFLDSQLDQIVSWNNHHVRHAPSSRELRLAIREVLSNRSQIVAKDVKLKVTFQPQSVTLYRLIGHEASAMENLIPQEIEFDLRSGESASTLFEVAINADGPETIAVVESRWVDNRGKSRVSRQSVTRAQFAPSFAEAPWSLQLAAFCAETAEVLRGSYFAPPASHDLNAVSETASRLPMRFRNKEDYQRLKKLWDLAAKATSSQL